MHEVYRTGRKACIINIDISDQQDTTKLVLLILLSLLYMFQATILPIFRSTLTVYTAFWDNVPTVLSAADR